MRITLASDPGRSGGYAVAFGSLDKVELYPWSEEDEWLAYLDELFNYEDSTGVEAIVELVPPFVGKAVPGHTSFKLGYNYGFICGSDSGNANPAPPFTPAGVAERIARPSRAFRQSPQKETSRSCGQALSEAEGRHAENLRCFIHSEPPSFSLTKPKTKLIHKYGYINSLHIFSGRPDHGLAG